LPKELLKEMNSYNKVQGFIDRIDSKASRAGFGIYSLWWSETEKEFEIRGIFLFKGTELP